MFKKSVLWVFIMIVFSIVATNVMANMNDLKIYRKVYPDVKPGCQYCHVDKTPKKDDGKHELNEYGMKLKELIGDGGELTEEMVESAGKSDAVGE